jgi:hypothetical protein
MDICNLQIDWPTYFFSECRGFIRYDCSLMHGTVTVMTIIWRWPMESFEIEIHRRITLSLLLPEAISIFLHDKKKGLAGRPGTQSRPTEKMANFCSAVLSAALSSFFENLRQVLSARWTHPSFQQGGNLYF